MPNHPKRRGARGEITQLPNGRWRARYWLNGRGSKRPQATRNTKAEASAWLADQLALRDAARTGRTASTILERNEGLTVAEMCERFHATYEAAPPTRRKVAQHIRAINRAFGPRLVSSVEPFELKAWKVTLPPASRFFYFATLRQIWRVAVASHWTDWNPCSSVENPRPRAAEVVIPTWEAVQAIADEVNARFSALPIIGAATGLRVEELLALHHEDFDLEHRLLHVRRVFGTSEGGQLVQLGAEGSKTHRQRRSVPLRQIAVDAYRAQPRRLGVQIVWPALNGGYLSGSDFRSGFWRPARDTAGVGPVKVKDLRHLYASEAIAASIDLFTLSRRMGTSLKQIDLTYGHLLPDAAERELALLDAWDAARRAEGGA